MTATPEPLMAKTTRFTVTRLTEDLMTARFGVHFPAGFTLLPMGDITRMDWVVEVREEVGFLQGAKISADLKSWGAVTVLQEAA